MPTSPVTGRRAGGGRDTRERFIEAAADLLQRHGYAATGVAEITASSGAPRGSLYFHFPDGKEQLGAEALELAGARIAAALDAVFDAAPDAATAVRTLVATMGARLQSSDYQLGCPIATTALEQAGTSPRLREATHAAFVRWLEILRVGLQADGRDPAAAEEQALFVLSAIEGALLLARAARSTRPLRVVAQQLATYLAASPA
jgi:TetR/AcrR family transcriptional repressor of lmrAB and yxaGH operons